VVWLVCVLKQMFIGVEHNAWDYTRARHTQNHMELQGYRYFRVISDLIGLLTIIGAYRDLSQ